MSLKASLYVWEHSQHGGSKLLVLLALADFADEDGCCWPGIERIVTKCRLKSERYVQAILKELCDSGELEILHNEGFKTKHGRTNLFKIAGVQDSRLVRDGVNYSAPPSEGVNYTAPQGVNQSAPKQSVKQSVNSSRRSRTSDYAEQDAERQALRQELGSLCGRAYNRGEYGVKSKIIHAHDITRRLFELGVRQPDMVAFGAWWYANDWRGKKQQQPTPNQIMEAWPTFVESRADEASTQSDEDNEWDEDRFFDEEGDEVDSMSTPAINPRLLQRFQEGFGGS